MARALIAVGVPAVRAYELARRIEQRSRVARRQTVELDRLQELAVEVLGEDEASAPRRLRRYRALRELDLPIDRPASAARPGRASRRSRPRLAYRLGITRVTSTDFIRQTMRAFFSRGVHAVDPLLELRGGTRAPRARGGRRPGDRGLPRPDAARAGRRARVASSARSRRAGRWCSRACTSCPGIDAARRRGRVVVQCVLAIERPEAHATHFWSGTPHSDGRAPARTSTSTASTTSAASSDYIVARARAKERPGDREPRHRERDRARCSSSCSRAGRATWSAVTVTRRARPRAVPLRVVRARRRSAPRSPARAGSAVPTRRRGGRGASGDAVRARRASDRAGAS